jgi:hypothetical protein
VEGKDVKGEMTGAEAAVKETEVEAVPSEVERSAELNITTGTV